MLTIGMYASMFLFIALFVVARFSFAGAILTLVAFLSTLGLTCTGLVLDAQAQIAAQQAAYLGMGLPLLGRRFDLSALRDLVRHENILDGDLLMEQDIFALQQDEATQDVMADNAAEYLSDALFRSAYGMPIVTAQAAALVDVLEEAGFGHDVHSD